MKGKKGDGLSFNMIVMAAIALVVLVVIISIFANTSGKTAENLNSCEAKGGVCPKDDQGSDPSKCDGNYPIPFYLKDACKSTTATASNWCCLKT